MGYSSEELGHESYKIPEIDKRNFSIQPF